MRFAAVAHGRAAKISQEGSEFHELVGDSQVDNDGYIMVNDG